MTGSGAIGEEIGTTFSVTLQFLDWEARRAPQLDKLLYEGYLSSLREAGWIGNSEIVRFGFVTSAVLFMALGGAGGWLPMTVDENERPDLEMLLGQPLEIVMVHRVNLFSAVMGAATVAGVYLCGRLLGGYRATAAAATLALAVSPTLWSQALIAEGYTAGAAFMVFILFALIWWDRSNNKWALFAAAALGGLSLGVHMSVILLAPAVLLLLLLHWRRGRQMWKTAALGDAAGLVVAVLIFVLLDWNNPAASYFNSMVEPSRSAWGYEVSEDEYPAFDPNLKLITAATIADLPPEAIVFTGWDMMWPYYYVAHLESDRADLTFMETFAADDQGQMADSLVDYVRANLGQKPMLFESRIPQLEAFDDIGMEPLRIGPSRFFAVIEKAS